MFYQKIKKQINYWDSRGLTIWVFISQHTSLKKKKIWDGDFKDQISLSYWGLGFTFAGANEKVAVRGDSTEGQIHHRPSVTGAGEWCLSHRHGSLGQAAGSARLAVSVGGTEDS